MLKIQKTEIKIIGNNSFIQNKEKRIKPIKLYMEYIKAIKKIL